MLERGQQLTGGDPCRPVAARGNQLQHAPDFFGRLGQIIGSKVPQRTGAVCFDEVVDLAAKLRCHGDYGGGSKFVTREVRLASGLANRLRRGQTDLTNTLSHRNLKLKKNARFTAPHLLKVVLFHVRPKISPRFF